MYAGRVVEAGDAADVYRSPSHPYTIGLLRSVPRLDQPRGTPLDPIPGSPPDLMSLPAGCPFRPRCAFATDRCATEEPRLQTVDGNHQTACLEFGNLDIEAVA